MQDVQTTIHKKVSQLKGIELSPTFILISLAIFIIPYLAGCTPPSFKVSSYAVKMEGVVSLGRVSNGLVNIYKLEAGGGRGALILTASTNSRGEFSVSTDYSGPVEVVAVGGQYTEEASGEIIELGTQEITAIVPDLTALRTLALTPLTHIAAERTLRLIEGGMETEPAIDLSMRQVQEVSGVANLLIHPLDASSEFADQASSIEAVKYSLVLAGLSYLADQKQTNSIYLSQSLAEDFAEDFSFDGQSGGQPISLAGTAQVLLGNEWSQGLALAMDSFIGNPQMNQAGFASQHKGTLLDVATMDADHLIAPAIADGESPQQLLINMNQNLITGECSPVSIIISNSFGKPQFDTQDRAFYALGEGIGIYSDPNCSSSTNTFIIPAYTLRHQIYVKAPSIGEASLWMGDFTSQVSSLILLTVGSGSPSSTSLSDAATQLRFVAPAMIPASTNTICWPVSAELLDAQNSLGVSSADLTLTLTETLGGVASTAITFFKDPQCTVALSGASQNQVSWPAQRRALAFFIKVSTVGAFDIALAVSGGATITGVSKEIQVYTPSTEPTPPPSSGVVPDQLVVMGLPSLAAQFSDTITLGSTDCHPMIIGAQSVASGVFAPVAADKTINLAAESLQAQFFGSPTCSLALAVTSITLSKGFSTNIVYIKYGTGETKVTATDSAALLTAGEMAFPPP